MPGTNQTRWPALFYLTFPCHSSHKTCPISMLSVNCSLAQPALDGETAVTGLRRLGHVWTRFFPAGMLARNRRESRRIGIKSRWKWVAACKMGLSVREGLSHSGCGVCDVYMHWFAEA